MATVQQLRMRWICKHWSFWNELIKWKGKQAIEQYTRYDLPFINSFWLYFSMSIYIQTVCVSSFKVWKDIHQVHNHGYLWEGMYGCGNWVVKVGFLFLFPLLVNLLNSLAGEHIYELLLQLKRKWNTRQAKPWEQVLQALIYKCHLSTKFIFIPSSILGFRPLGYCHLTKKRRRRNAGGGKK